MNEEHKNAKTPMKERVQEVFSGALEKKTTAERNGRQGVRTSRGQS
jgi:hypothetical protein